MPSSSPNANGSQTGNAAPKKFMSSQRPEHAGRPDTEFYWITVQGKACIGKAMTTALGPQVADLVKNEREVLQLLGECGAPVCRLVDYPEQPEWLVTEFAGLSLQLLGSSHRENWPAFSLEERVAVWAHFLYKAQRLADLGAVPLDLAERNLVVPMGSGGHLVLNNAVSIDHAHTVLPRDRLPGGELKRPVWINAKHCDHLAPEIRACLLRDFEKFLNKLRAENAPLLGLTPAVEDPQQRSANIWLNYDELQEVQERIDDGHIEASKAIQYAVGHAIHLRLPKDLPITRALAPVVKRLCADDPQHRYNTLNEAAEALKAAMGKRLALTSVHAYKPELPEGLVAPRQTAQAPIPLSEYSDPSDNASGGVTVMVDDDLGLDTPTSASSWQRHAVASVLALFAGYLLGQWLAQRL